MNKARPTKCSSKLCEWNVIMSVLKCKCKLWKRLEKVYRWNLCVEDQCSAVRTFPYRGQCDTIKRKKSLDMFSNQTGHQDYYRRGALNSVQCWRPLHTATVLFVANEFNCKYNPSKAAKWIWLMLKRLEVQLTWQLLTHIFVSSYLFFFFFFNFVVVSLCKVLSVLNPFGCLCSRSPKIRP